MSTTLAVELKQIQISPLTVIQIKILSKNLEKLISNLTNQEGWKGSMNKILLIIGSFMISDFRGCGGSQKNEERSF